MTERKPDDPERAQGHGDGREKEDLPPLAANVPLGTVATKNRPSFMTLAGRIFGGVLGFLSLWQVLTPASRADAMLGVAGLAVSILWFVRIPKYARASATAGLVVWIVLRLVG